ncbi:MAG: hypothetical protein VX840_00890 [Pseudomonadota bacterium]|nr:hypothetical protein [Pseudomonadota bacterium]
MTDLEVAFDWLGDPKKIEAFKKIRFKKHARLKNVPWTAEEKKQVGSESGHIREPDIETQLRELRIKRQIVKLHI